MTVLPKGKKLGLDQYAYAAAKADSWDKSKEIAYWRKHPNLQGWMERLWLSKLDVPKVESDQFLENRYPSTDFNGIELELTLEDLEALERDIRERRLPATTGFFFGNNSDDHYFQQDIDFIYQARADILCGLRVFYNSSW